MRRHFSIAIAEATACTMVAVSAVFPQNTGLNWVLCSESDGTISVQHSNDGLHCAHSMARTSATTRSGDEQESTVCGGPACGDHCVDIALSSYEMTIPQSFPTGVVCHPVVSCTPSRDRRPCGEHGDCTSIARDITDATLLFSHTVRLLL